MKCLMTGFDFVRIVYSFYDIIKFKDLFEETLKKTWEIRFKSDLL